MDLATFLSSTTLVPIADLTSLAALRECAGDDVLSRFRSQIELRQAAGVAILDGASQAGRQNLLASEQRDFDRSSREIDQVLTLIRQIEQRQYAPPPSQRLSSQPDPEPVSPVLARGQSAREWLTKRGGARYVDERGADRLSFGRILRGLALGNRQGMSDLELRVMSEGSGPAGQYTVPEVLSAGFIDQVRAAMVCMRAGAQIVPMTSETLSIARVASGPTVAWKSENSAITPGDLTLERVRFTARTLPVLVKMSVELSEDSTNIDAILERELAAALAVELDRVCLVGSGTPPEPQGIKNQSGVALLPFGSVAPTDFDFVVDGIGAVWAANFEPTARITNAALATSMAKFKSSVDSQPLQPPPAVVAVPAFRTNQLPSTGSPGVSDLFVGDFTQLLLGMRTEFQLEVSRQAADAASSAFTNMQVWIRAYLRADIQLAHPEAFSVTTDIGE